VIRFDTRSPYMVRACFRILSVCALALRAASAGAQQPAPATPQSETQISDSIERISENHMKRVGNVEIHRLDGLAIHADEAEMFQDEHRAILIGNVLFAQGDNRITAERAEINTETGLGTFYNAYGFSTMKPPKPPAPRPGAMAPPPMVVQDNTVYFFGDVIEKVAPKKYKITKGGFSTCVQPTPRWDLHADTVILNLDHYTILKNAILEVKGVPMFYLPVLYYPTKKDQRATGLLIPAFGTSTLTGTSLHNAFFWAINRSQDATFYHDWFSKTGQGAGSEYRYNYGPGENGNIRAYYLDQKAVDYSADGGSQLDASQSYEIRGSANQQLPGNLRARANVNYFSSIQTSQTFNTNIYDTSRNDRTFGANVVGGWGSYTMNATVEHDEFFYSQTQSALSGSWPQVSFARNERPIGDSPAYFSFGVDFARLLRETKDEVAGNVDSGLGRVNVAPQLRYPFKKWQWFTVNSTVGWRDTYYTRSLDPNNQSIPVDVPINRQFFTVQSQITGPVFNRVWDTPDNGYAEKFKHTVEPFVNVMYTSGTNDINQIIQFDSIDSVVAGTQLTYGLNNRFFAKRSQTPGAPAQSREIIDVSLTQSYYNNPLASIYDHQYQTTGLAPESNYSPIALSVRALPTNDFNATVSAEIDSHYLELRTVSVQGSYSWTNRFQTMIGWSKKAFIAGLPGFDTTDQLDHYINTSFNAHSADNKVGAVYNFNYDVLHSLMVQQQVSVFYNSQCCGIAMQYQTYNYGLNSFSALPSDHRFYLSFTLAGLGNFSPFNGALGSTPH
jgi:LPS-assembly protein